MAARAKARANLSTLVGSDSEQELDSIISTHMSTLNAARKPRGRPPAAAKGLQAAPRRLSGGVTKPTKAPRATAAKNKPSTKKANTVAEEPSQPAKKPRGRPKKNPTTATVAPAPQTSSKVRATRGQGVNAAVDSDPLGDVAEEVVAEEVVAEEAAEAQDEDLHAAANEMEVDEDVDVDLDAYSDIPAKSAPLPGEEEEEEEEDHAAEPYATTASLRRRVGDLTRKCELMDERYRKLQEIGIKEAERNYDRLRKQSEENTKVSDKLIDQLQAEVASQRALVKQGAQVRVELEGSQEKVQQLQSKVEELTQSLTEARSEVKTLNNKLTASRNAEAQASIKVPGSALKANTAGARAAVAQQTEIVQTAQLKEDLYGDLTGLIIRGLKRGQGEDVFDCIQTGRNGTLHFKLALESQAAADNYEDLQFTYRPQLDDNRDAEMIDMLPDYLVEEITFPRLHAPKFYSRVTKSLTERTA